jgi:hypothetical protein
MPLTKKGKKIASAFRKEYEKDWKSKFYAWENKHKAEGVTKKKTKSK